MNEFASLYDLIGGEAGLQGAAGLAGHGIAGDRQRMGQLVFVRESAYMLLRTHGWLREPIIEPQVAA